MADHFVCLKHGVCIFAVEGVTPGSVEEWLQSLRLSEYLDTFLSHNYNTMDRVRNIWELELNSVSESIEIHMQKWLSLFFYNTSNPYLLIICITAHCYGMFRCLNAENV